MLYKLGSSSGRFSKLEPVAFKDFSSFGNLEKDLVAHPDRFGTFILMNLTMMMEYKQVISINRNT